MYSDAGWAGCRETRKSTTGGCITIGKHTITGRSKTQSHIALSSGESELYSTFKAAAETFGLIAMLKDFGWSLNWSDANVAIGIINKNGLGKTRRIETGSLWVQHIAAQQRLGFSNAIGKDNPADLFATYSDLKIIDHHLEDINYHKTRMILNTLPPLVTNNDMKTMIQPLYVLQEVAEQQADSRDIMKNKSVKKTENNWCAI